MHGGLKDSDRLHDGGTSSRIDGFARRFKVGSAIIRLVVTRQPFSASNPQQIL